MTWLSVLMAIVVLISLVALSGVRPKGGRSVGRTSLMSAARIVLMILVGVVAYVVWTGWAPGSP
jgi:hypothetical protein